MSTNYVEEFKGHRVPERATHYHKGCDQWPECFVIPAKGMYYDLSSFGFWFRHPDGVPLNAVELPKINREKTAWISKDSLCAENDRLKKLLVDIKNWDVSEYLLLPVELRKRIQLEIGQAS